MRKQIRSRSFDLGSIFDLEPCDLGPCDLGPLDLGPFDLGPFDLRLSWGFDHQIDARALGCPDGENFVEAN